MKEIINAGELTQVETMTSREIAELTGKEHSNVMRDIRNIVDSLGKERGRFIFEESSYINQQNKEQPMYKLDKKSCLLLASGYSVVLRAKIINRWEELELKSRGQFKVPTSFAEALRLAAEQQEQIEQQQKQLAVQKPKVEFYDAVTDSKDTFDMAAVAKVLNMGVGRTKLFAILREHKVLRANNEPMQNFVDNGWMRQIETTFNLPDGTQKMYRKTVVFQKGLDGIRKILLKRK